MCFELFLVTVADNETVRDLEHSERRSRDMLGFSSFDLGPDRTGKRHATLFDDDVNTR